MALRINTNVAAINAHRQLLGTESKLNLSMEKLSSGFRINRASDDAAGLAISEGIRSQVGGLRMGVRNAQDGVSVVQTAEGALTEIHAMLQRMNDLAVQYNSGTQNDDSKAAIDSEFTALTEEIERIGLNTKFNGTALFEGNEMVFQVGYDAGDTITVTSEALASVSVSAAVDDSASVQEAITTISTQRATLGALQNRLDHKIANLDTSSENLTAAESRIRDVDMAKEMMEYTKMNILSQAAQAMLAQANQLPQQVLQLLQ